MKKYCEAVFSYFNRRRLIDAEDFGVILSSRDYYNSIRKEIPDKSKLKIIKALLIILKENSFVYYTRVKIKVDKDDELINKKLIQIFFIYRKQLKTAQRFIANQLIIIDGTFNINKLDLPLFIIVDILNIDQTFPVAFSYCPAESTKSISFVQDYLK